ncbi:hypothetical protein CAMRE0001_2336 [Campylobacter rectus RM3267]|uniref:Uncharacterized protein n=1 Tax=Campylobacter rectus RM3267 TaxID=553218 RepID=B9D5X4_CAMRE|nr:hypothetical protein CAMRE0001_2336 [Campylobacter rectus RM3267]
MPIYYTTFYRSYIGPSSCDYRIIPSSKESRHCDTRQDT